MGEAGRAKTYEELLTYCAAGLVLLLLACNTAHPTKIKQILDHPQQYDGRTVVIDGEVKESANVVVVRFFVVKDDTGEIVVVTDRAVPNPGEKIRVRGRVDQAFALSGNSLTVIIEEPGR